MNSKQTLKLSNEFAPVYDAYISERNWLGPDIIFSLMKPNIKKDEILLDIGMGTGAASIPFKNAGLKIYGIDGSEEMIRLCNKKAIAEDIMLSDLANHDLQFRDIEFDHIISNAVFHLVGDFEHIVKKAGKQLKSQGYFCFTTFPMEAKNKDTFIETEKPGLYSMKNNDSGFFVYRHSTEHVKNLLSSNSFELLNNFIFMGMDNQIENQKVYFEVFLSRKVIEN